MNYADVDVCGLVWFGLVWIGLILSGFVWFCLFCFGLVCIGIGIELELIDCLMGVL